jgi:hypothetical protein
MAGAQSGQILMTDAVINRLAPERTVSPLGRYRIRDFDPPLELYRDSEWAIAGDRPVRSTPTGGHKATFFGAVVSFVGPGDVGKPRLAGQAGEAMVLEWPDGVLITDLQNLGQSGEKVAQVMAAESQPSATRIDDVVAHLRSHRDRVRRV